MLASLPPAITVSAPGFTGTQPDRPTPARLKSQQLSAQAVPTRSGQRFRRCRVVNEQGAWGHARQRLLHRLAPLALRRRHCQHKRTPRPPEPRRSTSFGSRCNRALPCVAPSAVPAIELLCSIAIKYHGLTRMLCQMPGHGIAHHSESNEGDGPTVLTCFLSTVNSA